MFNPFTHAALAASLLLPVVQAANHYLIEEIPNLGGPDSRAYGINSRGDVSGWSFNAAGCCSQAFVFRNGALSSRPAISYGYAINDTGEVATSQDISGGGGLYEAVLWDSLTNRVTRLGWLPGHIASYGVATAGPGAAAGASVANPSTARAFRYRNGTMKDLGTLGGNSSFAWGMNDVGEVIGSSETPLTPLGDLWNPGHAFLFNEDIDPTAMVDLNNMVCGAGPHPVAQPHPDLELRKASGINTNAVVVGFARFRTSIGAFLFQPVWGPRPIDRGFRCGTVRALGTFPQGGISYALGVNDRKEVVGAAYRDASGAGNFEAFVWDALHGMRNLNSLIPPGSGWRLREATAINDNGWIAGWGEHNGRVAAFRLIPQ